MKKLFAAAATAATLALAAAGPAHAGNGFIAQKLLKPIIGKKAADKLDAAHAKAGKPLDRIVEQLIRR